jgi:uncharacterized short protein YbdD (DUF466 family)
MSIAELFQGLRWYLRELSGKSQYDHYLERCQRLYPDQPVMTLPEFERWRAELAENQSNTRCC